MRDVNFAIVDVAYEGSNAMNPNLEGLIFADDQAGFLAGVIAGGVASGLGKKVGVIGGLAIPPVKRFINGFAGGVEYACSGCSTTIIYCPFGGATESTTGLACPGTFADAVFGVGVAKYLITTVGVDVIFGVGGLTGSAGIKYASAPQGTSYSLTGRTSFTGTKTEAQAPYVIGVDTDEYYTRRSRAARGRAPRS